MQISQDTQQFATKPFLQSTDLCIHIEGLRRRRRFGGISTGLSAPPGQWMWFFMGPKPNINYQMQFHDGFCNFRASIGPCDLSRHLFREVTWGEHLLLAAVGTDPTMSLQNPGHHDHNFKIHKFHAKSRPESCDHANSRKFHAQSLFRFLWNMNEISINFNKFQ